MSKGAKGQALKNTKRMSPVATEDEKNVQSLHLVLQIADLLKVGDFLKGMEALFAKHSSHSKEGSRMVSSNAFLALSFAANISPHLATGVQVLQCVEYSLGGRPKHPNPVGRMSGLVFEEFVECLARIAIEIFPGVPADQVAHLLMLQLDQTTNCMTSQGKICHSIRSSAPARRVSKQLEIQAALQMHQYADNFSSSSCQKRVEVEGASKKDTITQRAEQKPTNDIERSKQHNCQQSIEERIQHFEKNQQDYSELQKQNDFLKAENESEIIQISNHTGQEIMELEEGQEILSPLNKTKAHQGEQKKKKRCSNSFLRRMSEDLQNRSEKIERLRNAAMPNLSVRPRKVEEQKVASERLYMSRIHHFERHKTKYDKIKNCDPTTGQEFFKPALITEVTSRQGTDITQPCSICINHQNHESVERVHIEGETCKKEECENRFEQLYRMALEARRTELETRQQQVLQSRRFANAPKASERSRYYFESKLLRDLSSFYLQANDASALAMSVEKCKGLLAKLIGAKVDTSTGKEGKILIERLVKYLDPEQSGTVTFVMYMNFVKRVVQQDPCIARGCDDSSGNAASYYSLTSSSESSNDDDFDIDFALPDPIPFKPLRDEDQSSSSSTTQSTFNEVSFGQEGAALVHQFRQRFMDQRSFIEAEKKLNRKPVSYSFTPVICPKSRELDSARLKRGGVKVPREQLILQHWDELKDSIRQKREHAANHELDGCTFKPKLRPYKKYPPPKLDVCSKSLAIPTRKVPLKVQHEGSDSTANEQVEQKDPTDDEPASPNGKNVLHQKKVTPKLDFRERRLSFSSKISEVGSQGSVRSRSSPSQTKRTPLTPRSKLHHRARYAKADDLIEKTEGFSFESDCLDFSEWQENVENGTNRVSGGKHHHVGKCSAHIQDWLEDVESKCDSGESICVPDVLLDESNPEEEDVLLFVDVQVKGSVERIVVYVNDDLKKVASRFAAMNELGSSLEENLYEHLKALIRDEHGPCAQHNLA